MKALVRIEVAKAHPTAQFLTVRDYPVLVANMKGKGIGDIQRKVDRLIDHVRNEEGVKYMGATTLYNKEMTGLGFIKHSNKNGFTGDYSKRADDLALFSQIHTEMGA
jgi:hypothetical protein